MFSQDQFKITGTVLDEDGNKIEIGDVLLRSINDPSEILEYTYIDMELLSLKMLMREYMKCIFHH